MEETAMPAKSREPKPSYGWSYIGESGYRLAFAFVKKTLLDLRGKTIPEIGGKIEASTILPRSRYRREQAELRRLRGLCEKLVLTRDAHMQWGPILKAIDAIAAELERAGGK